MSADRHTRYYVREKGVLVPRTLWFSLGLERWTLSHPPMSWKGGPQLAHNGAHALRSGEQAQEAIREWTKDPDVSQVRGGDEEELPELEVVKVEVVETVVFAPGAWLVVNSEFGTRHLALDPADPRHAAVYKGVPFPTQCARLGSRGHSNILEDVTCAQCRRTKRFRALQAEDSTPKGGPSG